jgi:putative transposase
MNKTIRKAFKFRLKVSTETSQKLANYAGGCRFVWNKALALNLDRLNKKQPIGREDVKFWEAVILSKVFSKSNSY